MSSFSDFGEMIDSGIDLNQINVYNIFVNYFENPKMVKIKDIQAGNYILFGCKIRTLLSRDKRYLFTCVRATPFLRSKPSFNLEDLEWSTFETRTLTDDFDVPYATYTRKDNTLNHPIHVITKKETEFTYNCQSLNITVTLLTVKNQTRIYNDKGTLGLALETFNTIVSMN